MNSLKKILILGSGQAAIYAASELRKLDKEASINILGEENSHPYERPPLSKDFLLNSKQENELLFFSESFFEEQNINYINEKIEKVNFQNKELVSINNKYLYDKYLRNSILVIRFMISFAKRRYIKKKRTRCIGKKKFTIQGRISKS